MKTTSDVISLTKSIKGTAGASADVRLRIYKDVTNQPTKPSNSSTVPSGWTDVLPSTVVNKLWTLEGAKASGGVNYLWRNPSLLSDRAGNVGVNGLNGSTGTRGSGFFTRTVVIPFSNNWSYPTVTGSEFNLDSRKTICEELNGTWTTSCSVALGEVVIGDISSITYLSPPANLGGPNPQVANNQIGMYNGSSWEAFDLEIDGSVLVNGTVVADTLRSNLVVTNSIKGGNKTTSGLETGLAGFFLNGTDGTLATGDGTDDMVFKDGTLSIPATALVSPDGTATPSNTAIYFKQTNASKFTLQVAGGKGFRSEPQIIDLSGHTTPYGLINGDTGVDPEYSVTLIPVAEMRANSVYYIQTEQGNGGDVHNMTFYLDANYECFHFAGRESGKEIVVVQNGTNVQITIRSLGRQYSDNIPRPYHLPISLKRLF